jgi:hypothetical protein
MRDLVPHAQERIVIVPPADEDRLVNRHGLGGADATVVGTERHVARIIAERLLQTFV